VARTIPVEERLFSLVLALLATEHGLTKHEILSTVTGYAARFMRIGGVVVLLFILFHLAHFTLGSFANVDFGGGHAFVPGEAYNNLVYGLSNPLVAGFYILANLALGMHLWHGVSSGLQTLGLNHPRYDALKNGLGVVLPILVVGGNILVVIACLTGMVTV